MLDIEELKEKAIENKLALRKKFVTLNVGDNEYNFRLAGIGGKAIKLEAYIKYDSITEAIETNNMDSVEAQLMKIIEEYEPEEETEDAE